MQYDFRPTAILTNMNVDPGLADDDEVSSIMNIADMKASFAETMEMMNAMVYIMVLAAVLLGVVVLYNLGVLSFVEKTTVVGIAVGLYAGWGMLYVICTTVSETLDMYPIITVPTYLYSIVGTFMVSVAVNFMFSGKVRTIDMVDALKGVE